MSLLLNAHHIQTESENILLHGLAPPAGLHGPTTKKFLSLAANSRMLLIELFLVDSEAQCLGMWEM